MCLGWPKLGCLSWFKPGVSVVAQTGVSGVSQTGVSRVAQTGGVRGVLLLEDGPQRGVRGGVFGGCVSTSLSVHGVATCALGIAPSEPVNPLPYCGFGRRNP